MSDYIPTDEDVDRGWEAALALARPLSDSGWARIQAALATIGPIIERERRAAQADILEEASEQFTRLPWIERTLRNRAIALRRENDR